MSDLGLRGLVLGLLYMSQVNEVAEIFMIKEHGKYYENVTPSPGAGEMTHWV